MILTPERSHNYAKYRRRRNNFLNSDDESLRNWELAQPWRRLRSDEPSLGFCRLDVRLIIMRAFIRLHQAAMQVAWAHDTHGCACAMCNCHKRRIAGNSMVGKTIQERKMPSLMDEMDSESTDTVNDPAVCW